jgi:hypothetical protein
MAPLLDKEPAFLPDIALSQLNIFIDGCNVNI